MKLDFDKGNGLIPVIIQNAASLQVLMLGYMNEEALSNTQKEGRVSFYSRSKDRLWTKGESSGNYLNVVDIRKDCDSDSLLIKVEPTGPTCHSGTTSCFKEETDKGFIYQLEKVIAEKIDRDESNSYTNELFKKGINKVAQKVGEEAVEVVIEAKDDDEEKFKNEAADLLYHLLILLKTKGFSLEEIESTLAGRQK